MRQTPLRLALLTSCLSNKESREAGTNSRCPSYEGVCLVKVFGTIRRNEQF